MITACYCIAPPSSLFFTGSSTLSLAGGNIGFNTGTLSLAAGSNTTFVGAVSATAPPSGPGHALTQFLGTSEAMTIFERHGLERVRP